MGAEGIELLIGRISLEGFGLPTQPKIELVKGYWSEGKTLRARLEAKFTPPIAVWSTSG
jgi:hypothetical protein